MGRPFTFLFLCVGASGKEKEGAVHISAVIQMVNTNIDYENV